MSDPDTDQIISWGQHGNRCSSTLLTCKCLANHQGQNLEKLLTIKSVPVEFSSYSLDAPCTGLSPVAAMPEGRVSELCELDTLKRQRLTDSPLQFHSLEASRVCARRAPKVFQAQQLLQLCAAVEHLCASLAPPCCRRELVHKIVSTVVRFLQGFRKVDPDNWEFVNEGFLKEDHTALNRQASLPTICRCHHTKAEHVCNAAYA